MGGLRYEPNINKYPALAHKFPKSGYKNCGKNHNGQVANSNTTNSNQGKTNQSTSHFLKVCHQNIRGLSDKTKQLLNSLLPDPPHIICLTEHHLKEYEINKICVDNYVLGANYCRATYKNGGVCIYIYNSIKFDSLSVSNYCVERDIEACAIKLNLTNITLIILAIYRSPSGNFNNFLQKLDAILNKLHNNKVEYVICGDVNINYLENCDRRKQLDALLNTYNLIGTVNFPTRIVKVSKTAIDNIYIKKD